MRNLTDEEFYSQLQSTPDVALPRLYERHAGPLFRFIYRFTTNRQTAEEILQDIFTQLLEGQFRPGPDANLKSWLYTLAKNKSLNHLKKTSREVQEADSFEGRPDATDLEASTIGLNLLQHLASAEIRLPDDLRETWQLRRRGLDYAQIAVALEIPVGTVKSRFHRLVEHLKKEFQS